MNTEPSLQPCPFCPDGGKPFIEQIGNQSTKKRGFNVGCKKCHIKASHRVIYRDLDWCRARVMELWNTRTPRAIVVEELEGAIEAYWGNPITPGSAFFN